MQWSAFYVGLLQCPLIPVSLSFQSNVKIFFKSVASFLSHDNWMNIIFSLSLLSISLDEPLGEKVRIHLLGLSMRFAQILFFKF